MFNPRLASGHTSSIWMIRIAKKWAASVLEAFFENRSSVFFHRDVFCNDCTACFWCGRQDSVFRCSFRDEGFPFHDGRGSFCSFRTSVVLNEGSFGSSVSAVRGAATEAERSGILLKAKLIPIQHAPGNPRHVKHFKKHCCNNCSIYATLLSKFDRSTGA